MTSAYHVSVASEVEARNPAAGKAGDTVCANKEQAA